MGDFAQVHLDGTVFGGTPQEAETPRPQHHAVARTSPYGESFIGTCINCGQEGLDLAASLDECPNHAGRSDDESVLALIEEPSDE